MKLHHLHFQLIRRPWVAPFQPQMVKSRDLPPRSFGRKLLMIQNQSRVAPVHFISRSRKRTWVVVYTNLYIFIYIYIPIIRIPYLGWDDYPQYRWMVVSNVSNPNHQWFFEMMGNCKGNCFFCWFRFLFNILFVKSLKEKSVRQNAWFLLSIFQKIWFFEWDGETAHWGKRVSRGSALQGNPRCEGVLCKLDCVHLVGPSKPPPPPKRISS